MPQIERHWSASSLAIEKIYSLLTSVNTAIANVKSIDLSSLLTANYLQPPSFGMISHWLKEVIATKIATVEELSKELLVKVTGHLKPDSQVSFLGRKMRHNGDSIDIFMPPDYVEDLLKIYNMQKANSAPNTGSSALKRIEDVDSPLSAADATFRTCAGKLLWLAFVRPDISHAVKELSRDVKSPTLESLAKLKHLMRFLAGNRHSVLRLRPNETFSDWKGVMDIRCYVDSDWAGCNKTRKSTSGSIVQVLGSTVVHSSRTQAKLYAIGQGVNEALFLKNLILEAEFARKVRI